MEGSPCHPRASASSMIRRDKKSAGLYAEGICSNRIRTWLWWAHNRGSPARHRMKLDLRYATRMVPSAAELSIKNGKIMTDQSPSKMARVSASLMRRSLSDGRKRSNAWLTGQASNEWCPMTPSEDSHPEASNTPPKVSEPLESPLPRASVTCSRCGRQTRLCQTIFSQRSSRRYPHSCEGPKETLS